MRRLVTLVALAAGLVAAAPAAAADRTDDTAKPVIFLSGGETQSPVDCKATWKPMQSRLRELRVLSGGKFQRFVTTPFVNVSTHAIDKNCEFNLGVADNQGVEDHAKAFGAWLKKTFGPTGERVDIVAAGAGGGGGGGAPAVGPPPQGEGGATLHAPPPRPQEPSGQG